jgi:transposase-like protein
MSVANVGEESARKAGQWRERVAEQQRSGMSVRQFCREQQLPEHAFYAWRKRLRTEGPLRFALLEPTGAAMATGSTVELVLPTGERLRIGAGVDARTLRTVLEALRA